MFAALVALTLAAPAAPDDKDKEKPLPEAVASIVPDWLMDLKDTSGHLYACGYAGHCTYASVEN